MAEIVLNRLKKTYDAKQVLHGIEVTIPDGAFVVMVGPSGCGKSTLLRMIAGLEDISEGSFTIGGVTMNDVDPADRGCAMVFQNYALYPHMTVRQNIGYPLKIAKLPPAERERRIAEAAAILNLGDYLDRRPAQLSGGQRQRVAMGRAIVREPEVFLFDEPLSNLDALLRVQMRIEIKRLHKRLKATSIFVTHDQVEAMTLADLLIVMNAGRVEQVGSPSEVYRKPASVFVAGFMGSPAMNLLEGTVNAGGAIVADAAPGLVLARAGDIPAGTPITIGVRPEAVTLSTVGATMGIEATIELVEELGGSRIAYCAVKDREIAVVLPPGDDLLDGKSVSLSVKAADLHLFDRVTGKRCEADALEPKRAHTDEFAG